MIGERNRGDIIGQRPSVIITRGRKVEQIAREIEGLRVIQRPFAFVFWWLEKRIARLGDELERRRE